MFYAAVVAWKGAWVLDPFAGSSTTGIAASLLGRRFLGIDQSEEFLKMSKARREEINSICRVYLDKLQTQAPLFDDANASLFSEPKELYGNDLPF